MRSQYQLRSLFEASWSFARFLFDLLEAFCESTELQLPLDSGR